MFIYLVNPVLWLLRFVVYLICGAFALSSIFYFFAGGWFVMGFMFIIAAEYTDFHNAYRSAFKEEGGASKTEFLLDYKAPTGKTFRTVQGADLASMGVQDTHQHILVQDDPNAQVILCPGCRVPYEGPGPVQCRYCLRWLRSDGFG